MYLKGRKKMELRIVYWLTGPALFNVCLVFCVCSCVCLHVCPYVCTLPYARVIASASLGLHFS